MNRENAYLAEDFFLNSDSEQLSSIYGWARTRYVSPTAVLFGVLLRVAACVPPYVQLPPVIGGRASLNLLCAFVGRSGTGKGASAKVAALAWPTDVLTLPIGSGQGIAEQFTKRDAAEVNPVIFDIPEIDTLTGLSSAHGSILLPTLKSLAMGEQLGQANATKDTSRNVPAHSYRACVSIGAQPGHTGVLFNDVTGGTPQRFLWASVTDPNIPDGSFPQPKPLSTTMPIWTPPGDGNAIDIVYSTPEIEELILSSHIARQRGDGDPLDGHALLTRCKVAALLAIMHQRLAVTKHDWDLSGQIMKVSDQTRALLRQQEAEIHAAVLRERGKNDALRYEGRDDYQLESVRNSVVAFLTKQGGTASASDVKSAMGKPHRRKLLPQAVAELADDGLVVPISVAGGTRYQLTGIVQGEQGVQGLSSQFREDEQCVQDERSATVVSLESRRPQSSATEKISCQKWFDGHLADLRAKGQETVEGAAVRKAGQAAGYSRGQLYVAATTRRLKGTHWPLSG
ncbi:hypothetical protein [Mycobacterium sp. shizuoka-1]|uniref:hypothetical protein n=1 Tax=Mycobacterium sp. shizuoka-1 TaxID=2039281 RepID=UPI000C067C9E|nr:hypothetical protein [Mycobacterium sp. shizuoka-1]GAY15530.1 hypothetical protein MSZK_22560 [Mycobacterium sp. shizuoka-1]